MRARLLGLAVAVLGSRDAFAGDAPDWFRAFQYASKAVVLRGCAECQGEPDDVCEVRKGAQIQALEPYARHRWPAAGRIKLLRSKADPDCAVPASGPKGLLGTSGAIELAAIRVASAAPSAALVERFQPGAAVAGWPRAPQRRKAEQAPSVRPQRSSLRLALLCWPSDAAWPHPAAAGLDGRAVLDRGNACEWWLLPVKATGEPDLDGASFALQGTPWPEAFAYGDIRWGRAFDRASALDESLFLGGSPVQAQEGPAPSPVPATPPAAPPPAPGATPGRCGEAARARSATLDRFDQWDLQIRSSGRRSLDRRSWTLNAAAWVGHCQEMDVLRTALEQQLGCALDVNGACAAGQEAR